MITVDYANEYLFEPLGIKKHKNYYAETAEEHKAFTIGKTPKEDIWFCDPDGLGTPGYGLCMSAEDMAKIGLLCLNKGRYDNKQIVSSKWIEEMIANRTQAKANKDWATADAIRDELKAMNITIIDTPQGAEWKLEN